MYRLINLFSSSNQSRLCYKIGSGFGHFALCDPDVYKDCREHQGSPGGLPLDCTVQDILHIQWRLIGVHHVQSVVTADMLQKGKRHSSREIRPLIGFCTMHCDPIQNCILLGHKKVSQESGVIVVSTRPCPQEKLLSHAQQARMNLLSGCFVQAGRCRGMLGQ